MKIAATNLAWSKHEMWRLAGAIQALRATVQESRALVAASTLDRLLRDCDRLEQQRRSLARDARAFAEGHELDGDALAQRIARYYRDAGDLERAVENVRL